MNLLLFVIAIGISFVVVRVGAVAFNLTGMEWSQAKFQALSCFSGTGFTTREAEIIVSHRQRRNIASLLMILGNAGLVTLIATFANSISTGGLTGMFEIPFLHVLMPAWIAPYVNLAVILVVVILTIRLAGSNRIRRRLTGTLRKLLIRRNFVLEVPFEELLISEGDYGVMRHRVDSTSPIRGKSLLDSRLREGDITVLVVEREDQIIPNPSPGEVICEADQLLCFGKVENMRRLARGASVDS